MPDFFKVIFWVTGILGIIMISSYVWGILDEKSYESFLLKGVSPLSQKSRNLILENRKLDTQNSNLLKK